jgi:hypothetical protein
MAKIAEVYNESQKNKVKGTKMAPEMTEKDFIKEHKNLIKILVSGSQAAREAEAKAQQEELDECLGTAEETNEPADAEDLDK